MEEYRSLPVEEDVIKLRGRIAALELATISQTLIEGAARPGFNPMEFAAQRAAFWTKIGKMLNDDGEPSSVAFEDALRRLSELLTFMAKPIDEALLAQQRGEV